MSDDDGNPFPDDGSYQDRKEKKPELDSIKYRKIPIRVYGGRRFSLLAETEEIGNYLPYDENLNLEEGIGKVIKGCRHNAEVHLRLVNEGRSEPTGIEGLAYKILNCSGNVFDLFMLVYPKSCGKSIEKQLGRYSNLEKKVIDNHKK